MKTRGYKPYEGRRHSIFWRILLALVILGVLLFSALSAVIGVNARSQIVGEPQAVVILGCQVKSWGAVHSASGPVGYGPGVSGGAPGQAGVL